MEENKTETTTTFDLSVSPTEAAPTDDANGTDAAQQTTFGGTFVAPGEVEAEVAETVSAPGAESTLNVWRIVGIIEGIVLAILVVLIVLQKLVFKRHPLHRKQPGRRRKNQNSVTQLDESGVSRTDIRVGHAQTIGARPNQEDSYCASGAGNRAMVAEKGVMAAVCDGIGGLNGGEIASSLAINAALQVYNRMGGAYTPEERLLQMVASAQNSVLGNNRSGKKTSGCTFVGAIIHNNALSFISVGDSRIALYRDGGLMPLNREHVLRRDREEASALHGQAKSGSGGALTSYIGRQELEKVDRNLVPIHLISGDRVLLMTDGVFGTLSDDEIIACLREDASASAKGIIERVDAKKKNHQDNATIVILSRD